MNQMIKKCVIVDLNQIQNIPDLPKVFVQFEASNYPVDNYLSSE